MRRIVIVGASLAGVHAAEALREHGFAGEITLLSAENHFPVDRPPLSKEFLLGTMSAEQTMLRPSGWYDEHGVELKLDSPATRLRAAERQLELTDGAVLDYDRLILATGSTPRRLSLPQSAAGVSVLRDLQDARALQPKLRAGRHLIVIGGGFIGLEVAGVATRLGLEVTVVHGAAGPLSRALGTEVSEWYRRLHERNGVRLICDSAIAAMEQTSGGFACELSTGERLTGDLVVAGIGATPATDWLEGSGVAVTDGVECAPDLSTSAPDVFAAGDIVRWRNPVFGDSMRIEHWSNAIDQGRHAAATALGAAEPFSSVPYFWTDQHDTKMRFVGRAAEATDIYVESETEDTLVIAYVRAGTLTGAVCVGAPRRLAQYRAAIRQRSRFDSLPAPRPLPREASG